VPLAVVLGVIGAACLGGGFVLQQREASQVDAGDGISLHLLLELMRRPWWWLGIGGMCAGYVLAGWSLGTGNLVLVEPLIAANLLFALAIAAVWCRTWPRWSNIAGAVALAAGVTGFVLAGRPSGGRETSIPPVTWGIAGAVVVGLVAGLVVVAVRRHGDIRAALLGAATGITYGMQDALTRRVYGGFHHGTVQLLAGWPLWTLIVVGALGVLLAQNAFDCAPLTSSLPAISVGEAVTGLALGILVFRSHVNTGAVALAVEAVSLVVMLGGAAFVSRAHVVNAATDPSVELAEAA
jgi:drug/metabolite transporter (DMT)-like permease